MANNQGSEEKPKVSKLPLPISDSPLVIDLPDGQKIVIGKMTQGSVIEVATWRGVGRPDSRTSRLMLGVGSGNVNDDSQSQNPAEAGAAKSQQKPRKPDGWKVILYYLDQVVKSLAQLPWQKIFSKISLKPVRKMLPKKVAFNREDPAATSGGSSLKQVENSPAKANSELDKDIEEWLNQITSKAKKQSSSDDSERKIASTKPKTTKKVTKRAATSKSKRR